MGTNTYKMSSSMRCKSQPERRMERATLEWHKKRWDQRSSSLLLLPPLPCPSFSSLAVMEDNLSESIFTSESFMEDYVLLLFLPMDGSMDKTELEAFSEELEQLESLGCQVVAITGDSVAAISHWIPNSQWSASTGICFPIISDKSLNIAKEFGVKRASGMMTRATFLLDKERKVCYSAVYPRCVARSPKEMVRQVAAAKELDKAEGGLELPANWQPGDQTLPVNLEDKWDFLGLDQSKGDVKQPEEEERAGFMGEPKVMDTISLFNHVVRDLGGPRDLSYFFQGL